MDGLAGDSRGLLRLAATLLAVLCAAAALAVAWPGSSRAQEAGAGVQEAGEGTPSTKPPPGREDPEPVRPVDLKPQEGIRAQAEVPTFTVFKDFNAWWGDNMDARTLGAMGRTLGLDWSNQMVPYCGNTGVPEGTDVAVFTSNSEGRSSTTSAQTSAACQANLERYLGTGGTLIVDMGDNDYYGGFFAPGSKGTPTLEFPDDYSNATLTAEARGPDGRLGTSDDHPLVKGPDGQAGTSDDLTDSNIDACCYVAHGNLQDGVALPAGATPLMTAAFGGAQKPIVAEYDHAGGHVIVDTVTKEFGGQQRTPTGEGRFIRNLFEYAQDMRGGGGAEPPTDGRPRSYVAVGDSLTTGHSVESCPEANTDYPYGCPVEPGPAIPYPDFVAERLGSPYWNDYQVAKLTDFKTGGLPTTPPYYNRVGVWGYAAGQAIDQYDQAVDRGDDRRLRRGGEGPAVPGPWEDQFHALEDAQDLATVTFGINDMEFTDPDWFYAYHFLYYDEKLKEELDGTKDDLGLRPALDRLFDEHLKDAKARGVEVLLTLYPNVFTDQALCRDSHLISEGVVSATNKELKDRADAAGIKTVDFHDLWTRDGVDHGLDGDVPWVFGTRCNPEAIWLGQVNLPDWINPDAGDMGGNDGSAQVADPHPNTLGTDAMAD